MEKVPMEKSGVYIRINYDPPLSPIHNNRVKLIKGTREWFKLNMPTFSTRALILGHQEMGTQIFQPII